ncbi:unnamed protein product [Arctia plantaginis]|uniref:Uncharacterized protein n=1 Tax=Arctia plantaginis TaxID=874455 RepID=A0A8S1BC94_ARCPL|nr:unnamed protein product [Arctia plantaginis]
MMQETVTNSNERKSLFSSFLEVLEAREKQAQADRQLQEEKYLRRTQRIYDFHERQRREAVELRRCLDYVSQHAHVLETVLRGAGTAGSPGAEAPLSATLVRQAAALQRCMAQCVVNASRIRQLLTATHQPQMDTMLAKMINIATYLWSPEKSAICGFYATGPFSELDRLVYELFRLICPEIEGKLIVYDNMTLTVEVCPPVLRPGDERGSVAPS